MKYRLFALFLGCLTGFAWTGAAHAQDDIYTKAGKDKAAFRGTIKQESPRGVKVEGVKLEIPADDIRDIVYEVKPIGVMIEFYRPALKAESEAGTTTDEKKRAKLLAEAVQKYEQAMTNLKSDSPFPQRHFEFKVALLLAWQAQEDGKPASQQLAVAKLKEFKTKHPQSWQLSACLRLLAQLQVDLKEYAEAEQTYRELAQADVADETRFDAELRAVQVSMRAGKHAEALKKLQALGDRLPKGSRSQLRAALAQAECLAAAKNVAEAKKLVKGALAEIKPKDKDLKALAYNTLGYCYYLNEQWTEARWEFLWVDVVYNQDKGEHAKALYYLAQIFGRLGEGDRARECLDALLNDRQFAGLEYQRRALREETK